ncbi:MAG: hypothetical protein KJ629_00465 [Candidatus Omnitrophica bacterium]|nr:hypothetical protein [Candidatus Omnitrophota bacterium]
MRKGFLLIAVYGVVAVLTILGSALILKVASEKNLIEREKRTLQAFYCAEAGLDRGMVWLRDQPFPPSGIDSISPSQLQNVDLELGVFSVTINPYENNLTAYLSRYKIISRGIVRGIEKVLTLDVTVDSFARYAYFTDDEHFRWGWWKIPVWFVNNDRIGGPNQTNSHYHIYGEPIFDGMSKTADNFMYYYYDGYIYSYPSGFPTTDNPQFNQGITLGVEPLKMPSKALDLKTAAVHSGLHLETPTTIVLKEDGTMDVTNAKEGWDNENMPLPSNGAVFVTGGDVYVSGVLKGQLSIGTNRNIVVTNNILYADDPIINPNSTDVLGLIAERDVIIDDSAPYDLEINASIMALGDSFTVENWWAGPPKGTLAVLGGIIQKERGPVGTFSGATGEKLSGYSKNYDYDQRLINQTPPHYPATGDYIVVLWKKGG